MKTVVTLLLLFSFLSAKEGKLIIDFSEDSLFTCSLRVHSSVAVESLFKNFASDSSVLRLTGSADSIYLRRDEKGGTEYISLFKTFGYSAKAVVIMKTDEKSKTIQMIVKQFAHNWRSVPKILTAHSTYQFEESPKGTTLLYTQRVKVDRKLGGLQRFLIGWQLKPLAKQIKKECMQLEKSKQ